ncbi:MAG: hypothetical protein ACC619_03630, partial [Paracoccaceae bacterium]
SGLNPTFFNFATSRVRGVTAPPPFTIGAPDTRRPHPMPTAIQPIQFTAQQRPSSVWLTARGISKC